VLAFPEFNFRAPAPRSPCPLTPSPPQSLPDIRQGYSSRLPRSARGQSIARRDPAVLIHSCAEKFSGQLPRNQQLAHSLPIPPGWGVLRISDKDIRPARPEWVGEGAYLPRTGIATPARLRREGLALLRISDEDIRPGNLGTDGTFPDTAGRYHVWPISQWLIYRGNVPSIPMFPRRCRLCIAYCAYASC